MFLKICVKTFYIFQQVITCKHIQLYYFTYFFYYYLSKYGNWTICFIFELSRLKWEGWFDQWKVIWLVIGKRKTTRPSVQFSSVQSLSRVRLFATPRIAACLASLPITNSRHLLKLMSIESVMPSCDLILCHPLLLPPIPPSIRVFSNESAFCMRWPEYWSYSFNISPSNRHPGLISFRMDWLDLLAVQGTLKSLLQHHSSIASILWRSAVSTVQNSHP